ncbi:hypothetical protein [Aurantimicrobium minutum]
MSSADCAVDIMDLLIEFINNRSDRNDFPNFCNKSGLRQAESAILA